eukprot:augustus_masked-scaffold_77-processed-gene-0.15-mRNA-1 protein AED:1.00 eAED:1.00 QI:0/-1/0/0/-1/1/1/0/215
MTNLNEDVSKTIVTIAQKSHTLLSNAEQVLTMLPPENKSLSQRKSYNQVLEKFKLFSTQTSEVKKEVKDILIHFVISPRATGHDERGNPTTLLPDMLSTKKTLEQEKYELGFQDDESEKDEEEETDLDKDKQVFQELTEKISQYNKAIETVLSEYRKKEVVLLNKLKKKAAEYTNDIVVTDKEDFDAGVLLLKYIEKGTMPRSNYKLSLGTLNRQ